jgi:hypothetical protein
MRLSALLLSAVLALAMTDTGSAQATLPNDDVNIANNPGSVRNAPPPVVESLDCTCRNTAAGAAAPAKPEGDAAPGDLIIDCSCRWADPGTTGALAGPEAAVPGSVGDVTPASR